MLPSLISLRELVICRTGRPFRRTFESAIAISPERQQRDARPLARIRAGRLTTKEEQRWPPP
jgi:hypothetical protein